MGNYYTQYGEIYCQGSNIPIQQPCIIFDTDGWITLKIGNKDKLTDYFIKIGLVIPTAIIIDFSETKITKEEICYIFNWVSNVSATDKSWLISTNAAIIKENLQKIKD